MGLVVWQLRDRSPTPSMLALGLVCAGAVFAASALPAAADIQSTPVATPQGPPDILERRREAHQERVRYLDPGDTPWVEAAPSLIPTYIVWPVFGIVNVGLVVIWLLVARHYRNEQAGAAVFLTGLARRRRRRSNRRSTAPATGATDHRNAPHAMQSLFSILRRSSRRRHHRRRHSHTLGTQRSHRHSHRRHTTPVARTPD